MHIFKSRLSLIAHKFTRDLSLSETRHSRSSKSTPLNVQNIRIKTCERLIKNARSGDWRLGAPNDGIQINVKYVDTLNNNAPQNGTIMAIHGTPGNYNDFDKLISHFGDDYRVLVPNFPDFSITEETNHFWHSAEEKAQFLRDFCRCLNITDIDCLIVHSAAVFPASYLWLNGHDPNNNFHIKRLALLNTPGPSIVRSFSMYLAMKMFIYILRNAAMREYLRNKWNDKWKRMKGFRNNLKNYDDFALLLSTIYNSRYDTVKQRLELLRDSRMPTLFLYGGRDKLFPKEMYFETLTYLGVDYHNYDVYEPIQNICVQKGSDNDWIKVINIQGGGHYSHITHSHIAHQYLEKLLEKNSIINELKLL